VFSPGHSRKGEGHSWQGALNLKLEGLDISADERVSQWIETGLSGERKGGGDIGGCDKGMMTVPVMVSL
jgi:hypothetical protein